MPLFGMPKNNIINTGISFPTRTNPSLDFAPEAHPSTSGGEVTWLPIETATPGLMVGLAVFVSEGRLLKQSNLASGL
jgi:hypothetical protein